MEAEDGIKPVLVPPAVAALKHEAAAESPDRVPMERTISMDIREERQDLQQAAEQSLNFIVDLNLDGTIRWVSPSWEDVVGTSPDSVQGKPIAELLVDGADAFRVALETMREDDSRSQITRFSTRLGPKSVLRPDSESVHLAGSTGDASVQQPAQKREATEESGSSTETAADPEYIIDLEAQGIMVHETSVDDSHIMWMIKPSIQREVTIDLPEVLVESLGSGAQMLAHYLNTLATVGANDPANHPPPLPALCRICERQITPWWFEKHTELCLQEHRAEMEISLAQENLSDIRNAIVRVLDALEARNRQPRLAPSDNAAVNDSPSLPQPEYKGMPIGPSSTPSSGPPSGRVSPASPPSRSRDNSTVGVNRVRSFAVRRPLSRIVELILDLCDTALEISTPSIKDTQNTLTGEFRTQSPQSDNRISQVLQWQSPPALENEQGLAALCEDTTNLAKNKVEAVIRHRRILEYTEKIRIEFNLMVQDCIDEALQRAARIAADDLSDSDENDLQRLAQVEEEEEQTTGPEREQSFTETFDDGIGAMVQALRNASNPSPASFDRRSSSVMSSTRSSSPGGATTPRSYSAASGFQPSNRNSMIPFELGPGGESDSSVRSSVRSIAPRADSPASSDFASQRGITQAADRTRRSLNVTGVAGSSRQHSPARNAITPSSPLRVSKPRIQCGGQEGSPSPITSPLLQNAEFPSPLAPQPYNHHHRRQSSTTSEFFRPPLSPRLNPQPRAVATSIKDFEMIKPISKGAFGSVYLAKKKSTGDYYAIKALKKADMVAKNQVANVRAERAIMMWQSESPFVAKLYWTFPSKDYLFLVMEYLNGGDLASLIKVLGGLPEDWAKKYVAEIVLGVEHLHSRGIVHRDLKPDNLLIDQKGHLKLTDFGLSRMGLMNRQKRILSTKSEETVPDLMKQGPFSRALSLASSRSASFDIQKGDSPGETPMLTSAAGNDMIQPSYFNLARESSLNRERSRRTSGNRSDSGESDALSNIFRRFSLADGPSDYHSRRERIEEETCSDDAGSPDHLSLQPTLSHASNAPNPTPGGMLPPPMALFDPQDTSRKFVGTPDYLAPETINGVGQDEMSDWWSVGCILFECIHGYPPFHADTPEKVFENILARRICWPEESISSSNAKDLMERLMTVDPAKRLGANVNEEFASGADEIRKHPWLMDINWETLLEDEASFVPQVEHPEDTEYFDSRGATLQTFAEEFEDQAASPSATPCAEYTDRPHDALSRVRTQVNVHTMKRGLMPLHVPAHVRDGRSRRLSEPVATDDFGSFSFKNLPVLEKANKDVIQKLRAEAMQAQSKTAPSISNLPLVHSPSPSLEGSPVILGPLRRTLSSTKREHRSASPSLGPTNSSPHRLSQPSSPLMIQFGTGQNHERRKTSSGSSSLSQQGNHTLQPGNFFETPRFTTSFKTTSTASSPIKLSKVPTAPAGQDIGGGIPSRPSTFSVTSPRGRSQTVGSTDSDKSLKQTLPYPSTRRSHAFNVSPSSSDNEDTRERALLRVQRRRQSSRRLSTVGVGEAPLFRPLDVLICEDHPVSRLVMEKLLEKLRCRTITAQTGHEALRFAMSEIKFDIILMEFKLPQINGADVARMIRETKNANTHTPIVAVTGYLKDLQAPYHFDGIVEKPPTGEKLTEILSKLCHWRKPPQGWTPAPPGQYILPASGLRRESVRLEDSPTSASSGFPPMPSSYRGSSREDSISSSFFGDLDSRNEDVPVIINRQATDEWASHAFGGLGISEEKTSETAHRRVPVHMAHPHLASQTSAPAAMESVKPRRKSSSAPSKPKRSSIESSQTDPADQGDDEDEELGDVKVRTKSPSKKPGQGTSKLAIEMMRTNSQGSVISVGDLSSSKEPPLSPPPAISEDKKLEAEAEAGIDDDQGGSTALTGHLTPPEIFPPLPGHKVAEINMDEEQTPRPQHTLHLETEPTPRPAHTRDRGSGGFSTDDEAVSPTTTR